MLKWSYVVKVAEVTKSGIIDARDKNEAVQWIKLKFGKDIEIISIK